MVSAPTPDPDDEVADEAQAEAESWTAPNANDQAATEAQAGASGAAQERADEAASKRKAEPPAIPTFPG